ncbi:aldo/keto reductase [Kineococcus sp. SYSU DK001]|uniref:aldo/keto reductase n=1 Tax=Kineococcus sp. SYSU DK001 TaxID=3383122 RepID=UPI003D7C86E1
MTTPRTQLRPGYTTPVVIKGNWQIADDHSTAVGDDDAVYEHLAAFVDAGIDTLDCGDIYYGVEERIGRFIERYRRERGRAAADRISVHTKFIPAFLEEEGLRDLDRATIVQTIDRSLSRLKVESLDLVQLHWWNYDVPGNVEAALVLQDLVQAGKIRHVGGTNYNVTELARMVDAGVDVVVNQVQYSLTDRRPANGLSRYCADNGIHLVAYGSMAGGLFSEKWLGIPDPGEPNFENVSLDKYYRIIVDFGGWDLFQELLRALKTVADRHGVSIPVVASRWVLDQPAVAAVIQGARHARHLAANLRIAELELTAADHDLLNPVLDRATGPAGDAYDLDRAENRDAVENLSPDYFDVEAGRLVRRHRRVEAPAELYGHHLAAAHADPVGTLTAQR